MRIIHPGEARIFLREYTIENLAQDCCRSREAKRSYRLLSGAIESYRRGWIESGLVKLRDSAEGRKPAGLCLSDLAHARGAA